MRSAALFATALLLEGCVTIPNTTSCTVAGRFSEGMICAEAQTDKTFDLTFKEAVEFLEPKPEAHRAGAICQSAEDFGKIKDALEKACRELGNNCTYEIKHAIQNLVKTR